jgi:hypothetical protein
MAILSIHNRWHPLYTSSQEEPLDVLETFRTRQHHEQGYRIGVHDEFLNAVPSGYNKQTQTCVVLTSIVDRYRCQNNL